MFGEFRFSFLSGNPMFGEFSFQFFVREPDIWRVPVSIFVREILLIYRKITVIVNNRGMAKLFSEKSMVIVQKYGRRVPVSICAGTRCLASSRFHFFVLEPDV
jgi:hypothetical protein